MITEIADEYKSNKALYTQKAKQMTLEFAMHSIDTTDDISGSQDLSIEDVVDTRIINEESKENTPTLSNPLKNQPTADISRKRIAVQNIPTELPKKSRMSFKPKPKQ